MAGCVWTWILTLCVFADIFLLTPAQLEHMRNIAYNKACSTSSRYKDNNRLSGDCSAAINGNIDTHFDNSATLPNCIHTDVGDNQPFWRVDLGRNFSLHTITIYGRKENLYRMDCVQVSLDGKHVYTFPCPGTTNVTTVINLYPPQKGRVVTITRHQATPGDKEPFLNICEVQIWVCTAGWWGGDCQAPCSQTCQGARDGTREENYCDSDTGTCVKGCVSGYWGENCTRPCGAGCGGDTCSESNGACQCRAGWNSPLCQSCSAGHYNESNECQNTCGQGCLDTCSRTDGKCHCQPGWQTPLCQRCLAGQYNVSNDCQNTCGLGCHDTCSRTDGTCQCQIGWQPPLCQYCSDGYYNMSNDCRNNCGEGCNNTCSRTDGTCQCRPGWQPPLCQWCGDGWFGSECTECGHCANNSVCDKKTGVCPFCDGDFVAPLCLLETMPHHDDKDTVGVAGPVAGAAVACSIVFLITGILIGL